jgi:hypothetical protein
METTKDKFAVIHIERIYHEGDERSRTHPGHGYPAHTEEVQKITTFKDEAALKEWILRNENTKHTVIRYEEVKVEKTINLKFT